MAGGSGSLPSSLVFSRLGSVGVGAAGSSAPSVRVPRARRDLPAGTSGRGCRDGRHHPRGAVRPVDVQADHDRGPTRGRRGRRPVERHPRPQPAGAARRREPLIVAFLVLAGFYPKPTLDAINPAVKATLSHVGVSDPAPTGRSPVKEHEVTTVSTVVMADTFTSASISHRRHADAHRLRGRPGRGPRRRLRDPGVPACAAGRSEPHRPAGRAGRAAPRRSFPPGGHRLGGRRGGLSALGAVVVDGPTIFLQAGVLVLALLAVLTASERLGGIGADAFTPMGAGQPRVGPGARRSAGRPHHLRGVPADDARRRRHDALCCCG